MVINCGEKALDLGFPRGPDGLMLPSPSPSCETAWLNSTDWHSVR